MSEMMEKNRFAELDGLRGIAALWVVVYHFVGRPNAYWLKDNPEFAALITPWNINLQGLYAVDLFFIISGFVIFMTIGRSNTVLDFVISRAARLYPAFWVCALVTTVIAIMVPASAQQITIGQAVVNATMLNLYFGVASIEPVYWSLAFEIGFYALIAAVFASGLIRRIEVVGCAWVAASFILLKLFPALGEDIPWRLQAAVSLPYASLFFAGIIFYKIWSEGITPVRAALIILCYFAHIANSGLIVITIMTAVFAIFSLCVLGFGSWLASRPLIFLGTISYSLYLIHGTLGYRLQLLNYTLGLSPIINLLVAIAVTICAAAIVTFLIERPANRAIRGLYHRATSSRRLAASYALTSNTMATSATPMAKR